MPATHDPAATRRWLRRYWARHGTAEDKFWARVEPAPGCWLWQGAVTTWGYGVIKADGVVHATHRLSWEIHNGPIPTGMMVCHHCDVRNCVNPEHLFLGTAKDNVADMIAKGRRGDIKPPFRRGEAHYAARLSDVEVAAIRDAVAAGELHRVIARRYSVTRQYVGMLAGRRKRV